MNKTKNQRFLAYQFGHQINKSKPKISIYSLRKQMNKRGISPVVATVLLVAIVVVIALIIFLWFRVILTEEATKFGKNVKLVCEEVQFSASYSGGVLQISNDGNVPIYGMKVKIMEGVSHRTIDLIDYSWPTQGLNQGGSFSQGMSDEFSGSDRINLIPVLLGSTSEGGEVTFVCENNGYEIEIY